MNTYAIESLHFCVFNTFAKRLKTSFLLCHYDVWNVDDMGGKKLFKAV